MMRLFRGHLDVTFQGNLRAVRIIAALELLSSPDAPITEIALNVGYQSISSFSRTFKFYVGKSPSVFRNEMSSTTPFDW
jgi:AraC-like DNA-binding protein